MNKQEKRLYREELRAKFIKIIKFEEKFIFWQNHYTDLRYLDDSLYIQEYIKAEKGINDVYRLAEIRDTIYKEYEQMGIYEPVPITNQEKAFVSKYWFQDSLIFRKKENPPIYDYETYKVIFLQDVDKKADKLEYANKELIRITYHLENLTFNNEKISTPNEGKKNVRDFFEDLTNNKDNFNPDFTQLYECSTLTANVFLDLYFLASYHIPLNQYKRFLKIYLEKNGHIETDENKLLGYDLGFSEEQLNNLYFRLIEAGFLSTTTKLLYFINAFNGKVLCEDFEVIKWKSKTKGAIFIKHYLVDEEAFWQRYDYLFEKGSYKQLLNQSMNVNNTYNKFSMELLNIDKMISNNLLYIQ
ncbi:hypothetical protein [Emticicia soli]|uniref:Uncharacterized protein n=1 Tax=Emticicia soli TaxID=2027878 RepID=A0ABW5J2L1_9BACT